MRLLDELKAVKCDTAKESTEPSQTLFKLNEIAKKMDARGLLTSDSLALHFFIRDCGNQFKQTFETMQEEYQNQPQQSPTLA